MYFIMDSDAHSDSSSSLEESGESGDENDFSEDCCFKKRVLQLPECFCCEEDVFREVLNPSVWQSVLNSKNGDRLKRLLPVFPEDDDSEKSDTLKKLFNGENFKFGNPYKKFFNRLKDGHLSSDVLEVNNALKRASYREYRNQQQQYSYHLLQEILTSRKKLIDSSYTLPPDTAVKMQQFIAKPKDATLSERTRLRYFSILQDIREEVGEFDTSSEDENYPESSPPKVPRKYKKQLQIYESSLSPEMARITATTSFRPSFPSSGNFMNCIDMFEVSDERYREMLVTHKERMVIDPTHPELLISNIDLKDVTARSNFPKRPAGKTDNTMKKRIKLSESFEKSSLVSAHDSGESESSPSLSNIFHREESFNSSGADTLSDFTPPSVQETEVQTDPLTILEEEDSQIPENTNQPARVPSPHPEVQQQQHPTCFFALLRDIFCESVEQKLSAIKLEEKVKNWQGGPTAALFDWLNFQESWSDLVSSALKFLAGDLISILPDTFVPFLDYKEKQQQWQWIGSGRDSDEQMYGLCQQWLENKDDISSDILETSQGSLPPPRVTTGWTVRPTAEEEKKLYREQECIRYQNPHKAFTFKVHGYEAVVGPVKGVYGKESGINKAREHSLLTSDRPPFVTILSLVRDSAARLPNGEGTRADICELLKDSQYLAPASDQQIHTVVSGALDRLHYEKDPCVKYDVNRKLWIYLHRHRTEEEFERIHQAQAAAAKARKAVQKSKLPKIKSKEVVHNISSTHISNQENVAVLKVDIPPAVTSGPSAQSPRGGSSPRTQGSPKSIQPASRFVVHAMATPSQADVKCTVIGLDNQNKINEAVQRDTVQSSSLAGVTINESASQNISSVIPVDAQKVVSSRQVSHTPTVTLPVNPKSVISSVTATQIVSVTPVQIKPCPTEQVRAVGPVPSHVHDVLNVDMKPSSPSFVGQPPVLQPILSHASVENANTLSNISTSVSPGLIPSTCASATKAKMNCASLSSIQTTAIAGFQTIVIKQEPGIRSCNGVSAIPLLSIEERLPSTNPSAINSGPVVARLVHGSQYLSFSNILASSTTCSSSKPLTGALQNFRVQGGNICQQVLSTSTIKVMHSSPVSAITDTRLPVIALKNQLTTVKEPSLISQTPASVNVCGRLYQMANVRNAIITKDVLEAKNNEVAAPKESTETLDKDTKDITLPALSISTTPYSAPVSISNKNTQTVLKVSPK